MTCNGNHVMKIRGGVTETRCGCYGNWGNG